MLVFQLNKKLIKTKRKKYEKKATKKETTNGKEVLLLQGFEKQPNLWMVKERTSDNNIIQKGFETIAQDVNAKLRSCITWKDARRRINEMRVEYSNELENQRNGKEFEMPWYSEHMKFLQENIDFLLKCRVSFMIINILKILNNGKKIIYSTKKVNIGVW